MVLSFMRYYHLMTLTYVTHPCTKPNVLVDSRKVSGLTRDMLMKLNALLLDKLMFTSTITLPPKRHKTQGTRSYHGVLQRNTQTC